jgi:hypothetical protein
MAFKDLFKRKPGGTKVGNLFRGIANKASGGVLGNGLLKVDENGNGLFYNKKTGSNDVTAQDNVPMDAQKGFMGLTSEKKAKQKQILIAVGTVATFGILGLVIWAVNKSKDKKGRR